MLQMHPKTVKESIALILSEMSGRDKLIIRNTRKVDLIKFHLTFGSEIRNRCGLWAGNEALLTDAGVSHPDSISNVIIEGIWEELQK